MAETSKRPSSGNFKQQKLRAWQPILTPRTVIATFFVVGIVFCIIGAILLSASMNVVDAIQRYDDDPTCKYGENCTVTVKLEGKWTPPIYMYYQLTNFYQNHRRYVESRSDAQLRGEVVDPSDRSGATELADCYPRQYEGGDENSDKLGKTYYPCGLIAASTFNDILEPSVTGASYTVILDKEEIAWKSDREKKFKEMDPPFDVRKADIAKYGDPGVDALKERNVPGLSVRTRTPCVKTEGKTKGMQVVDPDFIVWMRTAALPTFKKPYGQLVLVDNDGNNVTSAVQDIEVSVRVFNRQKHIYFSTTTWIGGKNDFLGAAYIVVGAICLILGIVFLVMDRMNPRKLGDQKYLVWSQPGQ